MYKMASLGSRGAGLTVVMLMMFATVLSQVTTPEFDHETEKLSMSVMFDDHYRLAIPHPQLKDYSNCLCSSTNKACSLKYERSDDHWNSQERNLFVTYVNPTRKDDDPRGSSSHTFQCEKPGDGDTGVLRCDRIEDAACQKPSEVFMWESFNSFCSSQCVNLCWRSSKVEFTGDTSDKVPRKGRCGSFISTASGDQPSPTLSGTGGKDGHSTSNEGNNLLTFIGIGVGVAFVVLTVAAVLIVFNRRRRSNTKANTSYPDIEPYALSAEQEIGNAKEAKIFSSLPSNATNIYDTDEGEDKPYALPGNVYSAIEKRESTSAKSKVNTTENQKSRELNKRSFEKDHKNKENNVYSQLSKGRTPVCAKAATDEFPTFNTGTTDRGPGDVPRTGSEGVYDSAQYARLVSRTELSPDVQKSLLDTYDVAAGQFGTVKHTRQTTGEVSVPGNSGDLEVLEFTGLETEDRECHPDNSETSQNCTVDNTTFLTPRNQNGAPDGLGLTYTSVSEELCGDQRATSHGCSEQDLPEAVYFELEERDEECGSECARCLDSERTAPTSDSVGFMNNHNPLLGYGDDGGTPVAEDYATIDSLNQDLARITRAEVQTSEPSSGHIYQETGIAEITEYTELDKVKI